MCEVLTDSEINDINDFICDFIAENKERPVISANEIVIRETVINGKNATIMLAIEVKSDCDMNCTVCKNYYSCEKSEKSINTTEEI